MHHSEGRAEHVEPLAVISAQLEATTISTITSEDGDNAKPRLAELAVANWRYKLLSGPSLWYRLFMLCKLKRYILCIIYVKSPVFA